MQQEMQKVFTRVAVHLLRQNKRAEARGSGGQRRCFYRMSGGLKCAAGCLIDDAYYTPDLEGRRADTPEVASALFKSGVNVHSRPMLYMVTQLQALHDMDPVHTWKEYLTSLASRFGLEMPDIEMINDLEAQRLTALTTFVREKEIETVEA